MRSVGEKASLVIFLNRSFICLKYLIISKVLLISSRPGELFGLAILFLYAQSICLCILLSAVGFSLVAGHRVLEKKRNCTQTWDISCIHLR